MILLLDNYDSFVHNVARYLRLSGKATRVVRSDAITAAQCYQMQPEAIILSPGPHGPEQAGCCIEVVQQLAGEIPMLGICLGHQAIAAAFGARITVTAPAHAVASEIVHDDTGVFAGLPTPMNVARYHSLCVDAVSLPACLEVTAWTVGDDSPVVMGISDHARCVHGVQFHPESLLTQFGHELIRNFFALVDRHHARARHVLGATMGSGRPVVWMSRSGDLRAALGVDRQSETVSQVKQSAAYRSTPFPTVSIAVDREPRIGRPSLQRSVSEQETPPHETPPHETPPHEMPTQESPTQEMPR